MAEEKRRYTCAEYREEMRLLALRRRLDRGEALAPAEREALLAEVRRLEQDLEMA